MTPKAHLSRHLLLFILFIVPFSLAAQIPTDQDCLGAIPVCEGFYTQPNSYSGTGNYPNEIPTAGACPGNCMSSGEKNDVWYYVTVQSDGLMGFEITPNNQSNDYDWAVYNLTDARCEDIFSQTAQLQVSCNWSAAVGTTGPNGGSAMSCQGAGGSPFNAMIPVLQGQNFVINISNYSVTNQSGYTLDFSLSTAQVYDDVAPVIEEIYDNEVQGCNVSELGFAFDERVRCDRVYPASFEITGPGGPYTVTDVAGLTCGVGTWEDEFILTVDPPFSSNGNYVFHIYGAFPAIVDACGNPVDDDEIPFTLNLGAPTLNESGLDIVAATCGMNNGSITGLSANGQTALNYVWKNAQGTVMGTLIDLVGVPAGVYTLEVHDQQFCITYGGPWEIDEFGGPELDDDNVNITSSNYGASNGSVTGIIVNSSFTISSYTWTNAQSAVVGNDLDLTGVPTGYYTLEVVDENTCPATAGPYFVGEIGGPLTVVANANPDVICLGDAVTLSAGSGGGSGTYTYTWTSLPAGFSSNLQNPVVTPVVTTQYFVTVWDGYIEADDDCSVTVLPLPVPDAGVDQSIPNGIYTFLDGSASNGSGEYMYSWTPVAKLEDAAVADPQTKNLYETTPFFLMVEDAQTGCIAVEPDEVIVEVTGGFLSTNPSAFPNSVCLGETFTLRANGAGGSGTYTYTWTSEPAMTLPALPTFDLTLNDPGTYFFYCLINDGYNDAYGYEEVTVNPAPEVDLGSPVQQYCIYDTVILDAGNIGSEYLWSNGATTQYLTVGTTGLGIDEQEFSVTVTNQEGCEGLGNVTVVFSYDNCVGVDEIYKDIKMQIYPNPTTGMVNIIIEGVSSPLDLQVINTLGHKLSKYNFIPHDNGVIEEVISLQTYPKGIYFIKIDGEKIHKTVKILLN